jgi:CheY-like chemotaxis protein/HPt (histidine-containing phosphotransfer) domain-containing protein
VNRRFVTRVLQKRGHSVSTAANGRLAIEAIERLKPRSFDVVLMDVQMPELDGLSATVLIRGAERSSGAHVPILAMTAHAMAGDRDRCTGAGMDDYVTKPLHPHALVEALERVADRGRSHLAGPPRQPPSAIVFDVFDRERARARLGGDRRLLGEMIAIFRAESPALMTAIRKAAKGGDAGRLRQAVHTLKGSLGTLDAPRAFRAAQRLEDVARQDEFTSVAPVLMDLEARMTELARALAPSRRARIVRGRGARHGSQGSDGSHSSHSSHSSQGVAHSAGRQRARRRR